MSKLVITLGNEDIVNLLNGRAVEFGIKDVNLIRQGLKDVELHVGMDIPMKYRNIASIIRCKDCEYSSSGYCIFFNRVVSKEEYCSNAKRKGDI
jgi:hypothetical protein